MKAKAIYLAVAFLLLVLVGAGCTVESGGGQFHAGDPVREVRAEATAVAVDIAKGNADVDLQVRQADLQRELEAHAVALEATRTAYTTQMQTQLIVATVEAGAQADAIRARGQAEASTILARADADIQTDRARADASVKTSHTLATAGAIAIPVVAVGGAVAFVILAWGHSTATVKRAMLTAGYVRIGVENQTLLPPPLVIHEGYLIDTRSGERARLSDPAGVDRMRLAATAHATEVALTARSLVSVAKATKNARPGDMLPSVAGAIPVIVNGDVARGELPSTPRGPVLPIQKEGTEGREEVSIEHLTVCPGTTNPKAIE